MCINLSIKNNVCIIKMFYLLKKIVYESSFLVGYLVLHQYLTFTSIDINL